jgi:hypothetical protein
MQISLKSLFCCSILQRAMGQARETLHLDACQQCYVTPCHWDTWNWTPSPWINLLHSASSVPSTQSTVMSQRWYGGMQYVLFHMYWPQDCCPGSHSGGAKTDNFHCHSTNCHFSTTTGIAIGIRQLQQCQTSYYPHSFRLEFILFRFNPNVNINPLQGMYPSAQAYTWRRRKPHA